MIEQPGVLDLGNGVGLAPHAQDVGVVDPLGAVAIPKLTCAISRSRFPFSPLFLPGLGLHRVHRLHDRDRLIERHHRALKVPGGQSTGDLVDLMAQAPTLMYRFDEGRVAVPRYERYVRGSVEVAIDLDPGVGADDRRSRRTFRAQGAGEHGLGAAVIAEQHGCLRVNAGERRVAHRHDPIRRAEDHRGKRHRIHAEVEQGATAQFGCEQAELGVLGKPLTVVRGHGNDVAEHAPREPVPDHDDVWQKPGPHRLHGEPPVLPRELNDLACLESVHRERLLDQHVLERPQREDRVVMVHRVRRCHVDHIDVRVGHE